MGYAAQAEAKVQRLPRAKMKKTLRHKFRDWLFETDKPDEAINSLSLNVVEESKFQSDGIRLQIYKASGGYVVETRGYDRKIDRSNCKMFVINEEADLGAELGKIVMMEALKR